MEDRANHRQTLGRKGEEIACGYLQNLGHTILERNWRKGHLEVDIISLDHEGIHFVEVKARQKNVQAPPQDNVGPAKQKHLTKAALGYLHSSKKIICRDLECFFDVIAITFNEDGHTVEWIPQAFIPIYM